MAGPLLAWLALALFPLAAGQSSVSLDWAEQLPPGLKIANFRIDFSPAIGELPYDAVLPPDITRTEISNALPATNYSVVLTALLAGGAPDSPLAPFVILNSTYASSITLPSLCALTRPTGVLIDCRPGCSYDRVRSNQLHQCHRGLLPARRRGDHLLCRVLPHGRPGPGLPPLISPI